MPISKVIAKARPDHPSLDFDVLRAEGIQHLENFATEIWTDYNAHDPGITLLELLCYAITDLGYRTRMLPLKDLIATKGQDENVWYQATAVLPSSPVTQLDFRKLLIDVKGVKNAWLHVADQEVPIVLRDLVFHKLLSEQNTIDKGKVAEFIEEFRREIPILDNIAVDDALLTEVVQKIDKEITRIKTFPLIKPYVQAIGQTRADLDRISKYTLKEHLSSYSFYLSDEDIDGIWDLILASPTERNLPLPRRENLSINRYNRLLSQIEELRTEGINNAEDYYSAAATDYNFQQWLSDTLSDQVIQADTAATAATAAKTAMSVVPAEATQAENPIKDATEAIGLALTAQEVTMAARALSNMVQDAEVSAETADEMFTEAVDVTGSGIELANSASLDNIAVAVQDVLSNAQEARTAWLRAEEAAEDGNTAVAEEAKVIAGQAAAAANEAAMRAEQLAATEKTAAQTAVNVALAPAGSVVQVVNAAKMAAETAASSASTTQELADDASEAVVALNTEWEALHTLLTNLSTSLAEVETEIEKSIVQTLQNHQTNLPALQLTALSTVSVAEIAAEAERYETLQENGVFLGFIIDDSIRTVYRIGEGNLENVRKLLRFETTERALNSNEQALFEQIPATPADAPSEENRRKTIMADLYESKTTGPHTLFDEVYVYYIEDLIYQKYFDEGQLAEAFFQPTTDEPNGEWDLFTPSIRKILLYSFDVAKANDDVLVKQIKDHYFSDNLDDGDTENAASAVVKFLFEEKFCDYGLWLIGHEGEAIADGAGEAIELCGLYHILLDLDENIDTGIPNQVYPVIKRVKDRIHKNRSLCEDFVKIEVLEQRPIGLCINMEIEPSADEVDIAAEAIRQMQEYLSPVPRFRTFKQRVNELQAAGENCSAEQIFDGPCLENGFLLAEEMGGHSPRDNYYHSDLLNNMMSVKGIIGLPVLKVDEAPEDESNGFDISTTYEVYNANYPKPGPTNPDASYLKPIIDLQQSFIQVKKGARTFSINMDQVEDRLNLFRLINSPDPLEPIGGPEWENGTYRPDLSNHHSVQFDLPDNYLVGDNPPPADSTPARKAKSKQLQAFLAFFDQILASYLHQLGRVREMLSVEQEANAATWVLPLMYDMPGLRDLIGHDSPFQATASDWNIILEEIRDDLMSISKGQGNTNEASDRTLAELWVADYRGTTTDFAGFVALTDGLKSKLSGLSLPDMTARRFSSLYLPLIENYFWKKFQADDNNSYVERMNVLSESPAEQQNRKNRLLDHLLARFGESFSEFATALLRPEAEPEDNPRQQSFEDYLKAKTEFLQEIADLAKRRSLGYNYLAYRDVDNAADIWNTLNVSGVQQRVVRKLGMSNWETRSLNTEPNYRIDRIRRTNRRGMANFRAALRRRTFNPEDNPMESTPLMTSPAYNSPRLAQDKINELYRNIWEAEFREITDTVPKDEDFYWYRLLPGRGGKFRAALYKYNPTSRKKIQQGPTDAEPVPVDLLLQSELLSEDEARNRIFDEIIPLTRLPQTDREHEGFHIVEHILLRPLEADDPLLQLSLGCVPEETPKDPYTFWVSVIVPADTTRFADPDFRGFFEHTFREELPAHIAPRFCYLDRELMYEFEELYAIWMFEKAKCDPPSYCREDVARGNLIELLNRLPCGCGCSDEEPEPKCE